MFGRKAKEIERLWNANGELWSVVFSMDRQFKRLYFERDEALAELRELRGEPHPEDEDA